MGVSDFSGAPVFFSVLLMSGLLDWFISKDYSFFGIADMFFRG